MQQVANVSQADSARQSAPSAEPDEAAIEVTGLSHVYAGVESGVPALQDISLSVGAGKFVVIVGPSGCGKTSLLMMMAGLRHQTSGEILCYGKPIRDPDPDRVGVIFQEASLFPWLSSYDNIEFPLSLRGVASGGLLVFISAIGYYITPALIGGPGDQMISSIIAFYATGSANWGMAGALGVVLLVATLLLYSVYARLSADEPGRR